MAPAGKGGASASEGLGAGRSALWLALGLPLGAGGPRRRCGREGPCVLARERRCGARPPLGTARCAAPPQRLSACVVAGRRSGAGLPCVRPSRCGARSPAAGAGSPGSLRRGELLPRGFGCLLLPSLEPSEVGCGGETWGLLSAWSTPCLWQSLGTSRGCASRSGAEHPCEAWVWWGVKK